jgi:hypothetical protein
MESPEIIAIALIDRFQKQIYFDLFYIRGFHGVTLSAALRFLQCILDSPQSAEHAEVFLHFLGGLGLLCGKTRRSPKSAKVLSV